MWHCSAGSESQGFSFLLFLSTLLARHLIQILSFSHSRTYTHKHNHMHATAFQNP